MAEPGTIWKVDDYNHNLVKPAQIEVTESKDNAGNISKEYLFSFNTHGAGESVVNLVYLSENDSTQFPQKTFEVKVICGTMGLIESN